MALLCLPAADVDFRRDHEICRRIEAEFREMPGLTLTLPQAARLFGVEQARCEQMLLSLVRTGLLTTARRSFARADGGRLSA